MSTVLHAGRTMRPQSSIQRIMLTKEDSSRTIKYHMRIGRTGFRVSNECFLANLQPLTGKNKPNRRPALPIPDWKRILDVGCVSISLPFLLPLMALIVLWIWIVSDEPPLLRQARVGRKGKTFTLYKFRSIISHANASRHASYVRYLARSNMPMVKLDLICDIGLIAGGPWLRASGLDELPQLWNVLRGEMSLVGPRPCLPGEYALFSQRQRERLDVLPGITGLWQVSGKNQMSFREMNIMDVYYARNVSWLLDMYIMARTPAALLHEMWLVCRSKFKTIPCLASFETSPEPHRGCSPQAHGQL